MQSTRKRRRRRAPLETVQSALNVSRLDFATISSRLSIQNSIQFVVRYYTSKRIREEPYVQESGREASPRRGSRTTLLAWMLDLTRTNMKSWYETCPGWGWSDSRKREELEHTDARFLVAFDTTSAERPVGFVHLRYEVEEHCPVLYVYELQICSSSQGCGLGTWLMQHVQAIANDHGLSRIMLTVFCANIHAVKFYRKLGYTVDPSSPTQTEDQDAEEGYLILSKRVSL